MPLAYQDGQFIDKKDLRISPADFGFSRGISVFELTRVYGGKPFRLSDHMDRFAAGAQTFGIACPLGETEIRAVVQRLITTNRYAHSVIKFYLTAGECASQTGIGFGSNSGFTPHLLIIEEEVSPQHIDAPRGLEMHQKGIALKSIPYARQLATLKSINYSAGFVAAREWAKEGWDEILFTHDGFIAETTISNFFAVIDNTLCTPVHGMLHGITRKVILEEAGALGLPTAVRDIKLTELAHATEAFITGSFQEMMAVRKVDDYVMKTTNEGPFYSKLRAALTATIKRLKN